MNHRMATRVVIAGAALAVAVGISRPAAAHAGAPQTLLQRYQPVTVLDATEQFPPTGVARSSWTRPSRPRPRRTCGAWSTRRRAAPAARGRQPGLYRPGPQPVLPAEPARLHASHGHRRTVCYHDAWLSPAPRSLVYGRSVSHRGQTLLQYWYFSTTTSTATTTRRTTCSGRRTRVTGRW